MATKQRCPKCNALNSLDALRCSACKAPLRQVCPLCGASRPWYVEHCPYCESQPDEAETFASLFRQTPNRRVHGHYIIQETLGASRVSTVYRVTDSRSPGSTFALKELATTALFRPEERREAATALHHAYEHWSLFQHPALPRLVELFSEHEHHYVVMELVDGWSLRRILAAERVKIAPDLVRNWGAQLCDLLIYLHTQDSPQYVPFMAPQHVMITGRGEVRLVDFGFTHLFAPSAYGPLGSVRGYAAPELRDGVCTTQSDIFAVGRILYALLIGQPLEQHLSRQLPLAQAVPGISPQLVKVIARAAHRDPARRFASAAELRAALWDDLSGPLEPVADWFRVSLRPLEATTVSARPVDAPGESMSQLGFERDGRFAPPTVTPELASGPSPQPKLSVHPHAFDLSDLKPAEVRRLVLNLRNAGEGELVGHITSRVGWITAPAQVWRLPAGKQAKVILSIHSALLPSGRTHEPQAIAIDSNAGRQWIGVSADIASGPSLGVEQPVLDYGTFQGDEERSLPVVLVNRGRQPLTGSVASRVPWLRLPQPSFRCPPGQSARVAIVLLPDRLPQGPQEAKGALVVDSDGGQEQIEVRAWRKRAVLDIGAAHMDFGVISSGEAAERYLYIGNTGDGLLEGTARSLVPWLQASPQRFTCDPGEMVQITVTADSVGLPDGALDLPQALRVQTNGGILTLSLHMQIHAPRMVLGTAELSFGAVRLGETRERPLIIRNTGSATLSIALQSMVDWLSLPQAQLVCEPGQEASVAVHANTSRFSRGQEIVKQPALRLIAGSTITELPASITVLQPSLRVEPPEVDFGYIDRAQPETAMVIIANDGTGDLAWNAQADAQWLEFAPRSGVCEAGQSSLLTLTAYGLALESGVEAAQGTLIITSDGGRAKVPLRIGLAAPRLEVDTGLLDLGASINFADVNGSFRIFNRGLGLLRGSIRAGQTWLVMDRASFECSTGRSIEVRVATDMAEYPADTPSGSGLVSIESNGGSSVVEVRVRVILSPCITVAGEAVLLSSAGPDEPFQGRLVIKNTGRAVAHTHLAPSTAQLVLPRELCDIKPDKSVRIAVRWDGDRPNSDQGVYIEITSGDQQLRVPVRFADLPPSARTAAHITGTSLDESPQATMRIGKEVEE